MIANTAKQIMINWLQRDFSFSEADARAEVEVLFHQNKLVMRSYYLTVSRVGLKALGGRAVRSAIYDSAENAVNHAWF